MLTNIVKLEVKVAEKVYHLFCDNDSPINDVKEAISQLKKVVEDIEQKIVSVNKEVDKESKPVEALAQEEEVK